MYTDTIVLYNRHARREGDIWYPTLIAGCDLIEDRAAIMAKYGENAADSARLHIRTDEDVTVAGKQYYYPKEWKVQANKGICLTFKSGNEFDFFVRYQEGMDTEAPISDDDYPEGFYEMMRNRYDNVYAISTVSQYTLIPHFEILGR